MFEQIKANLRVSHQRGYAVMSMSPAACYEHARIALLQEQLGQLMAWLDAAKRRATFESVDRP